VVWLDVLILRFGEVQSALAIVQRRCHVVLVILDLWSLIVWDLWWFFIEFCCLTIEVRCLKMCSHHGTPRITVWKLWKMISPCSCGQWYAMFHPVPQPMSWERWTWWFLISARAVCSWLHVKVNHWWLATISPKVARPQKHFKRNQSHSIYLHIVSYVFFLSYLSV